MPASLWAGREAARDRNDLTTGVDDAQRHLLQRSTGTPKVILLSLLGGDRIVLMQKFDAGRVIGRHRVSTFTATPTMLKRLADVVVIGLPDEEWGQRVHAVVEAKVNRGAMVAERTG